jgi:anti-sigma B factor antagonist
MEIIKKTTNGTVTLAVEGKLSAAQAEEFSDAVRAACAEADTLTIDFGGVSYLSSAGLRVLVSAHKSLKARGGALSVSNVRKDSVREIFEITGFDTLITVEPSP